ncbi:MAG: hypothetical protein JSV34_06855, partial [Candidatus Omnitrophota bacterium]
NSSLERVSRMLADSQLKGDSNSIFVLERVKQALEDNLGTVQELKFLPQALSYTLSGLIAEIQSAVNALGLGAGFEYTPALVSIGREIICALSSLESVDSRLKGQMVNDADILITILTMSEPAWVREMSEMLAEFVDKEVALVMLENKATLKSWIDNMFLEVSEYDKVVPLLIPYLQKADIEIGEFFDIPHSYYAFSAAALTDVEIEGRLADVLDRVGCIPGLEGASCGGDDGDGASGDKGFWAKRVVAAGFSKIKEWLNKIRDKKGITQTIFVDIPESRDKNLSKHFSYGSNLELDIQKIFEGKKITHDQLQKYSQQIYKAYEQAISQILPFMKEVELLLNVRRRINANNYSNSKEYLQDIATLRRTQGNLAKAFFNPASGVKFAEMDMSDDAFDAFMDKVLAALDTKFVDTFVKVAGLKTKDDYTRRSLFFFISWGYSKEKAYRGESSQNIGFGLWGRIPLFLLDPEAKALNRVNDEVEKNLYLKFDEVITGLETRAQDPQASSWEAKAYSKLKQRMVNLKEGKPQDVGKVTLSGTSLKGKDSSTTKTLIDETIVSILPQKIEDFYGKSKLEALLSSESQLSLKIKELRRQDKFSDHESAGLIKEVMTLIAKETNPDVIKEAFRVLFVIIDVMPQDKELEDLLYLMLGEVADVLSQYSEYTVQEIKDMGSVTIMI